MFLPIGSRHLRNLSCLYILHHSWCMYIITENQKSFIHLHRISLTLCQRLGVCRIGTHDIHHIQCVFVVKSLRNGNAPLLLLHVVYVRIDWPLTIGYNVNYPNVLSMKLLHTSCNARAHPAYHTCTYMIHWTILFVNKPCALYRCDPGIGGVLYMHAFIISHLLCFSLHWSYLVSKNPIFVINEC